MVPLRTIQELKTRLDGSTASWTCDLLALEVGRRATLRYVIDANRTVGEPGVVLRKGTVTIAHYWIDRPFHVYHWIDGGSTVAYYASVAEISELTEIRIAYLDLAIDVLIMPSGGIEILDEDEVPADLAPDHRKTIADALESLITSPRSLIAEIERESAPYR